MDFIVNNINLVITGGVSAAVLWVFKKMNNDKLYDLVENSAYAAGKIITLNMSSWKYTKKSWKTKIEPYFVDLIDNTVGAFVSGLISGLRSDD